MNRRTRHNFTLIELLAVMLLMGALLLMMLPAFNQMIRGNKVDQMTANLALGLEQAQARAISSRRHVAVVFPTKQNDWTSTAEQQAVYPFCYGGYRLAYVKEDGADWDFIRWVPDSEWKNAPDGAMLVAVYTSSTSFNVGDGLTGVLSNPRTGGLNNLLTLKNVKLTPSSTAADITDCALIFSPYGGLKSSNDLRLAVAEAVPSGTAMVYPAKDSTGPTNWLMLSINKFTGRVEYYPVVD